MPRFPGVWLSAGPGEPGNEEVRGRSGAGEAAAWDYAPKPVPGSVLREAAEGAAGPHGAPAAPQHIERIQGKLRHVKEQNPFVPARLPLAGHGWEGGSGQALGDTELFAQEGGRCNSSCPRDQAKPKANISIQHLQEELETYFLHDLKGIIFPQL